MCTERTLFWAVAGVCQLRCRYCFYQTGLNRLPPGVVNASAAATIVDRLKGFFPSVFLTGGEPLLNPSFWKIVALSRQAGLAVSFFTDGLGLNESCLTRIREYKIASVYVSLDSLSPKINEAIRCPRESHHGLTEQIIQNITALSKNRPRNLRVVILQTVCRLNIDSVEPMVRFCQRIGADHLVHPAGIPVVCSDASDIKLESGSSEELRRLEDGMLIWSADHEGKTKYTHLAMDLIAGASPTGMACPMGKRYFFLDVDGKFSPCFHRMDLALGNVYHVEMKQLLGRSIDTDLTAAPCASLACACMLE